MSLVTLANETIVSGLNRSLATTVSRWATRYRVMGAPFPGRWTHTYFPWLIDMADAEEPIVIGQKAAQVGFSEWAINTAFYHIDIHRRKVLYVMPTTPDASDFTADRFNPALDLSPHIRSLFSDVNNVGLKTGPYGSLYVRGARSSSGLKSADIAVVILDEIDEMPERSVNLARRRMSGQTFSKELQISTPTFPGEGINASYELSTKDSYFFQCPACSKLITLTFPDSFKQAGDDIHSPDIYKSRIICTECKKPLPIIARFPDRDEEYDGTQTNCIYYKPWLKNKEEKGTGHMVSAHKNREYRGFHVNCMYSAARAGNPVELSRNLLLGELSDEKKQEVYNSDLGLPVQIDGAKITDLHIEACVRKMPGSNIRTLGFDVGRLFHTVIKEWYPIKESAPSSKPNDKWFPYTMYEDELYSWDEVWEAYTDYGCKAAVMDAEPEGHAALQFCRRAWGRIYKCDYNWHRRGKTVKIDEPEALLFVNRTAWLDHTLGRIKNNKCALRAKRHPNFDKHLKSLTRATKRNKQTGDLYAFYSNAGPDHFAHADVYAELALPFALRTNIAINIEHLF